MKVSAPRLVRLAVLASILHTLGLAVSVEAKPSRSAKPNEVSGTIAAFDCGDNCYLTIKKATGEEVYALCHAPQCAPWVEEQAIPRQMLGRAVTATLGKGKQVDGAGAARGEMQAFVKLKIGK